MSTVIIKFRPKDQEQGIPHKIVTKLAEIPFRYQLTGAEYVACLDQGKTDAEIEKLMQYKRISKYGYFFMYDFSFSDGWFRYTKQGFPTYDGELDWLQSAISSITKGTEIELVVEEW